MGSHRVGHDWSDLAAAATVLYKDISKSAEITHKTGTRGHCVDNKYNKGHFQAEIAWLDHI